MSRSILVLGESGSGKTTSCRTLDPATTFYIDCDKKGLSFRGWRKSYNVANKNYLATSDTATIAKILERVNNGDLKNNKIVVIDTLNAIMLDDEFRRMGEKGYDKWQDLAASIYGLISRLPTYRDDLTVVCMAHCDRDDTGFTRMKTSGKKLNKIVPESKFTTVLLAKSLDGNYVFETRANNSTAKTPLGCFDEPEIANDMGQIIKRLDIYEYGEE